MNTQNRLLVLETDKMENMFWVGIGGFLGANARYVMTLGVNALLQSRFGDFPFGTLAVNVLGSFGLAVFGVWFSTRIGVSPQLKLVIATGFFGAFTTFSTFANESIALFEKGGVTPLLANIIVTNGMCLLGVVIGLLFANRLFNL